MGFRMAQNLGALGKGSYAGIDCRGVVRSRLLRILGLWFEKLL